MDRLDGSYIKGFTAGLQKARDIVNYINDDLKYHHLRYNSKTMSQIMEAAINGRAALRENPEAFVRYNTLKKDFEVYEPKR